LRVSTAVVARLGVHFPLVTLDGAYCIHQPARVKNNTR
jgi:hypothetical protein